VCSGAGDSLKNNQSESDKPKETPRNIQLNNNALTTEESNPDAGLGNTNNISNQVNTNNETVEPVETVESNANANVRSLD